MMPHEIEIRIDRCGDGEAACVVTGRLRLGTNEASFDGAEFDRFAASSIDDVFKAADRVPAPLAALVPFEEVPAFGVMLLAAVDPDVVANDPALFLNHRSKSPLFFNSDVLDDVDTLSVLLPGTAMDFCS